MNEARKRLETIATRGDADIDLAEVALLIAKEEYPDLDVGHYLSRLDDLAASARDEIGEGLAGRDKITRLNHFLFVEQSFSGNEDDYYDPKNSFLNEVIDRRIGIPISLAVVYTEVARRLGIPVEGVGFPGHFLVRLVGEPEVLIDPYFGRIVTPDECQRRLEALTQESGDEDESPAVEEAIEVEPFRTATPRDTAVRMLRNLKQIYVSKEDHLKALACVERILLFLPEDPEEVRDRGILYLRLECYASALRDLEYFLKEVPQGEGVDAIREAIPDLRREAERLQ